MSLIITIVSPWGIWQCSDHRLTDPRTGQPIEDSSVKHTCFRFPDGGALLAYAGIGSVGNVHISDWVRKILRGENRTLDGTFIYLREEATKTIGPIVSNRYHHIFSIGGFLQRRPWIVQIRNFEAKNPWEIGPPLGRFVTAALEIKDKPMIFVNGVHDALTKLDIQRLVSISSRRPRRPEDFHELLSKFNQKASRNPRFGSLISPSCVTSFMPPEAEPINSKFHGEKKGDVKPLTIPHLLFGIDLTEMMRVMISKHGFPQQIDAVGRIMVSPEDPISKK